MKKSGNEDQVIFNKDFFIEDIFKHPFIIAKFRQPGVTYYHKPY